MNAIIERQRQDIKNTYTLYADAEKCFDKHWLKDSLIEIERIGYNKNDLKMFYEITKTTEIVVDTAIGDIESVEIKEVVKQGSIFGRKMCCTTTAKLNDLGEKVDYKYGEIEKGMPIYMDDISVAGGPEEVKKRIRKYARMDMEKKMKYSLRKTQYMFIKTGKEKEQDIPGTSESREHSKNQEIQILRNHNK